MDVERVKYKYGTFDLKITGDPNSVFDVPIAYYTSAVFSAASIGAKLWAHDKILEAYAVDKAAEDSHENWIE